MVGKVVRGIAGGLVAVVGVLALGPAALLLVVGETRAGRLAGGAALACLAAGIRGGVLVARRPHPRPWPWRGAAGLCLTTAAALAVALARTTPRADPDREFGLQSRFVGGLAVPRYSPAHLVPESDQVKLGVTLATRPLFWSSRARTIREVTTGLYRSIEADPDARGLRPVTHFAALGLVGVIPRPGHYWTYVPKTLPGEAPGAIVFLHGNGGSFQVVPYVLGPLAEASRCVIICPTFGFGFWGEGGAEAVDRAWADASARWPIDRSRVYLGGISDGGVGVTRSAAAHPGRYRGLIYVSPTLRLDELAAPDYTRGWKGRPILVLQGDRDGNVPKSSVDPAVALLRDRAGAEVDYRVFAGEDHFLFFSRRRELTGLIGDWMARPGRPPAPP